METDLDARLDTVTFKADPEPHIVVRGEICLECVGRPCVVVCPARLFVWEDGGMTFNCEGCLECGSCRVVCPHEALQWRYPLGGYGVRFRWG
jgi:ferredoxin like protein